MSEHYLYLTTRGRTSGKPRSIEIWFVERGGCFYIVSERRRESQWVKNIENDPAVTFSVGARGDEEIVRARGHATARMVLPEGEPDLAAAVAASMDAKYRWSDGLIVELRPSPD
jgi:deazaflavin-dependent oxidoreductase (nitroreductase family)